MAPVFTIAIFLAAGLLFLVQPMVAKLLLPTLGGSPAVWNTAMVFFQVALLGGYVYAHLLTTRAARAAQVVVHALVLGAGAAALPIALRADPATAEGAPTLWLLGALATAAGLPFFAIASAGPLLQRWFSRTGHKHAHDPYFLYAASNAGSMLGLLAYPLLLEPNADLSAQAAVWGWGFYAFAALAVVCGVLMARGPKKEAEHARQVELEHDEAGPPIEWKRRLWWVFLAFVPSSLLLGVTQHLTTDVAAVPLLWILPLLVYLLSFVVVFAKGRVAEKAGGVWAARAAPVAALALCVASIAQARDPITAMVALHSLAFFVLCVLCHGRLAADRPPAGRLTEFYLFLSVGGALGGVFNALVAPVVFDALYEYPIAIALACLALPARDVPGRVERFLAGRVPLGAALAGMATFGVLLLMYVGIGPALERALADSFKDDELARRLKTLLFALPVGVIVLWARGAPWALSAVVACSMLFASVAGGLQNAELLLRERTFFGVHTVSRQFRMGPGGKPVAWNVLMHGTTIHGVEPVNARAPTPPTSYYHPRGPLGDLMSLAWSRKPEETLRIGLVGLGAGAAAAYARPGDDLRVFEIDPAVVEIASDPGLFTYLAEATSRGVTGGVFVGDGRLLLRDEPDGAFDVLILDAFSSDAIPVHLLTREAIAEYATKLAPGGLLVFHISNRHLDLSPVLRAAAGDLGLAIRGKADKELPDELLREWKERSTWVVMAHEERALEPLLIGRGWLAPLDEDGLSVLWTDAYSNILRVLN